VVVVSWNPNGLPAHRIWDGGTGSFLSSVDIFGVWDTRNNDAIANALPSHVVVHTPIPVGARKASGQGGAIGIAKSLVDVVQFCGWNASIPLGWVRLPACYIGFVYARHSMIEHAQGRADFMAHLHAAIAAKQQHCPVIIMGDLNAEFGCEQDAGGVPRTMHGKSCALGKMVMDMARRCGLMTTTGRLFDNNQASWVKKDQRGRILASSRIDHALVQCELWSDIQEFEVVPQLWGSDHHPLRLCLAFTSVCPNTTRQPVVPPPFLRWDYSKQHNYVTSLIQQPELWNQLHKAISDGNVAMASMLITSLVWAAATRAGMVIDLSHRSHANRCLALSLSPDGRRVQQQIKSYRKAGIPVPTTLRAEWRRVIRLAREVRAGILYARLIRHFWDKPRLFWKQFKSKAHPSDALLHTNEWRDYYMGMFGGAVTHDLECTGATHAARVDMSGLMSAISESEVVDTFRRLGTAKACGLDKLPAEFITKAFTPIAQHTSIGTYHFASPLAAIFTTILDTKCVPDDWKVKCIHPIHKRGDKHDPSNYRPLGVSTTMYILLTNILTARIMPYTAPSHAHPILLDNQFAFRREVGVEHAHVPILTAIDIAKCRQQPLVVLKLDVEKAYDTVHRPLLWKALREEGLPHDFIQLLQDLYREAKYVVAINGGFAAAFTSVVGLLQGCPLSPVLYSLFLKGAIKDINSACSLWGVRIGAMHVCSINFADDITALLLSIAFVATYLNSAERILGRKNQALSRPKCKALIINPPADTPESIAGVPVVSTMKVLGIEYDSHGNTNRNVDARASKGRSKVALAFARMAPLGCSQDAHINLLLLSMDVRPTLLFGAALWGSHQLHVDPMNHPFQPVFSVLLRNALRLPACTANWIATLMGGQLPVQLLVILEFCRFWCRLVAVAPHNGYLKACMFVQCTLARAGHDCWLSKWIKALQRVQPTLLEALGDLTEWPATPVPTIKTLVQNATSAFEARLTDFGDPLQVGPCLHRKIALHYRCMWPGRWARKPWYLWCNMPEKVRQSWIKFVSCNAEVPSQSLVWGDNAVDFAMRICRKCNSGEVANELHVLLHCPATASVRDTFRSRLCWPQPLCLDMFLRSNTHLTCAIFVHVVLHVYNARPDVL
jgi:hypothetical protein